jgi:predicted Zn-dependent protease
MRKTLALLVISVTLAGCGISTQQEIEMGQQDTRQINQQLPLIRDPEVNRYINVLGDSIAKLTARGPDLPWTFYVVNSSDVNAFAVPGGFIYVNRGVIERAQKLDQLAGVLGHEIGHVVMRHSVKQMEKAQGANVGLTAVCVLTSVCNSQIASAGIQIGGAAVFAKFSRDDEAQADEVGVDNVVRAGIDPRGIPEMFRILLDLRQSSPSAVEGWFASHPTEEARIADVNAKIQQINPAVLRTLTQDSRAFQAFKQRVASLPPPGR